MLSSRNRPQRMSASDPTASATSPGNWVANQPYLLLCVAALCWAGNAIVGRLAAGHIPPVTLSFLRWSIACLILLPFARKHLKRDWRAIRGRLGIIGELGHDARRLLKTKLFYDIEDSSAVPSPQSLSSPSSPHAFYSLHPVSTPSDLVRSVG